MQDGPTDVKPLYLLLHQGNKINLMAMAVYQDSIALHCMNRCAMINEIKRW